MNRALAASAIAMFAVVACDNSNEPEAPQDIDVEVDFAALVNGATFACGQSYDGVGSSGTTITPVDYRLYVYGVELIDGDGNARALDLDQDGTWQRDDLALLDFENGQGPCVNGTAATNTSIRGTILDDDYTAIRFTLGVPEAMNHADQSTAQAPLDLTALFWSWNAGYKFARIDHTSAAQPEGWFVHLGSTGCTPTGDPTTPATSCTNGNRTTVTLTDFDWQADEIVADYGALLAGSDLTQNTGAKGCMSFPDDPECPDVMGNFGLDYGTSVSTGQTFFRVR